ncbi:MAG: DUF6765 family protein [Bacillota bacterium]
MDFDFHYYGTLSAAKFAGYDVDEARQIAIAAQFVDEFTYRNFNGKLTAPNYTAYDFDWRGYIDQGTSFDSTLAKIWVPFHFLPRCIKDKNITIDSKGYIAKDDIADDDLKYMAQPRGELYNMVYGLEDVAVNDYMAIGLKMHVLADAFSHQGFVGYRKLGINCLESKIIDEGQEKVISNFMLLFCAIGHADSGHYPDFGYAEYEYKPYWEKNNTAVERCNPEIFADAYISMVKSMNMLRNRDVESGLDVIIADGALNTRRNAVLQMLKNRPSCGEFQEVEWLNFLRTEDGIDEGRQDVDDQSMIGINKKSILEFFDGVNNTCLTQFNNAAKAHYDMVNNAIAQV